MKPLLTIFQNEKIVNQLPFDRLTDANEHVQTNPYPLGFEFVYSTFTETGIENTVKLKKHEI